MSTTKRIVERLPEFYKTRTQKSLIYQFIDGFGKTLREAEKDLFRAMRGHWIDTAKGADLDHLASTFNLRRQKGEMDQPFRRRIKRAIQEYKGGGTIAAIELALKALLGPEDGKFQIVEFPPTPLAFEIEVTSGDTWKASSLGIADVIPTITMTIESKGAEVRNPQVENTTVNQSIGIKGVLKSGQELTLSDGKASIDGVDTTRQITGENNPPMLRRGSEWQYTEFLHGRLGVFDSGMFDEAFFATPLPRVKVRFDWITQKGSTIEVRIPKGVLDKTGLREDEIARTLSAIKASGIEMSLRIQETLTKPPTMTPITLPPPTLAPPTPPAPEEVEEIHA